MTSSISASEAELVTQTTVFYDHHCGGLHVAETALSGVSTTARRGFTRSPSLKAYFKSLLSTATNRGFSYIYLCRLEAAFNPGTGNGANDDLEEDDEDELKPPTFAKQLTRSSSSQIHQEKDTCDEVLC